MGEQELCAPQGLWGTQFLSSWLFYYTHLWDPAFLWGHAHTCPWSTSQRGLDLPPNCKVVGHPSSRELSQCLQMR